jgi:hypothetical protein
MKRDKGEREEKKMKPYQSDKYVDKKKQNRKTKRKKFL